MVEKNGQEIKELKSEIPWIFEIRAKDSGIQERFWDFTKDSGISRKILGFHERFRDSSWDSRIPGGISD
jgi:hypothetical protein